MRQVATAGRGMIPKRSAPRLMWGADRLSGETDAAKLDRTLAHIILRYAALHGAVDSGLEERDLGLAIERPERGVQ